MFLLMARSPILVNGQYPWQYVHIFLLLYYLHYVNVWKNCYRKQLLTTSKGLGVKLFRVLACRDWTLPMTLVRISQQDRTFTIGLRIRIKQLQTSYPGYAFLGKY